MAEKRVQVRPGDQPGYPKDTIKRFVGHSCMGILRPPANESQIRSFTSLQMVVTHAPLTRGFLRPWQMRWRWIWKGNESEVTMRMRWQLRNQDTRRGTQKKREGENTNTNTPGPERAKEKWRPTETDQTSGGGGRRKRLNQPTKAKT